MIKKILVGLDGSDHSRTGAAYALWLGKRLDAKVVGLHIVDIVAIEGSFVHDISGSLGFEPYLDFSSKMREVLHERGKGLLEEFRALATERGVTVDTEIGMGIVANELAEHAKKADLVVVGHRGVNEKFTTGLLGSTTESVTRKCPRPLFVSGTTFEPITKPLLAYDGSTRAAGAMQAAAEWCTTLQLPLAVLTVGKDEETAQKRLQDARTYLAPYSIEASFVHRDGHPPEVIVETIETDEHDALFVGAYGHSRIIEMVLGSTTEYVLRNSACPVFLSR